MPTYEYECTKCGSVFERFQKISEPPVKRCPQCRGKVVRKLGTGAGIIFKGSGFYATDYRSESYKKAAKAETSSTTDSKGTGEAGGSKKSESGTPSQKGRAE